MVQRAPIDDTASTLARSSSTHAPFSSQRSTTLLSNYGSPKLTALLSLPATHTPTSVIIEVLNEGLPRAAYLVIGDPSAPLQRRLNLVATLLAFQMTLGFVMSVVFLAAAPKLAGAFVPESVRQASIEYVRISAFSALTSAAETAVSLATRSLDRPDIPLAISLSRTVANIILDFLFLSTFRVHTSHPPTVNTQASIRMACNGLGCIAGLVHFFYVVRRLRRHHNLRT
ncbi:hypothetical protein H0H87_000201 [Tephrocybe sp. NHM501043]|nr:hypothetical protein H0H87_000201 [Tephrocybe sp. NHM501043]